MYVCMYVRMHACMSGWMDACRNVCMCACMPIASYTSMSMPETLLPQKLNWLRLAWESDA